MAELGTGGIRKMTSQVLDEVDYTLPIGDGVLPMNDLIGQTVQLEYLGEIRCVSCGRKTKKRKADEY